MPDKTKDIKSTILVVDDERAIRNTLREILEYEGYLVLEASDGDEAISMLKEKSVDLMLLDVKMRGKDGMEVLKEIHPLQLQLPVIMISGHGSIELAVEATRAGAFDFISKPPDLNRLLISVRNGLIHGQLRSENENMRKQIPGLQPILGESPPMQHLRQLIRKVAASNSRALITGDNGTGKELVARWIHEKSNRKLQPFIALNCAAIPGSLIESELFGYEKGAFTGAEQRRLGKLEMAHKGTLFLDEVADLSLETQAKLLRALQEQQIIRVGGNETISLDVRILAATNKKLEFEVKEKRFREDLFHRLNVIPIEVPALNKRREDISQLAQSFLEKLKANDIALHNIRFEEGALQKLKQFNWTGNVRQLQNVVERLAVLCPDSVITKKQVSDTLDGIYNAKTDTFEHLINEALNFQDFKERTERLYLEKKLEQYDWNISQTADAIGIQRSHIYNKLKKYNLER